MWAFFRMRLLLLVLLHQFEVLLVLLALMMQTLVLPEQMLLVLRVLLDLQNHDRHLPLVLCCEMPLAQVLLTLPRTLCRRLYDRPRHILAALPFFSLRRF